MSWESLNLNENLARGIYRFGFEKPTPIQEKAIPSIIEGRDIIGQGQSGTGKTGSFAIGSLQRIDISSKTTQALILAPTFELVKQISTVVSALGSAMDGLVIKTLVGGTSVSDDTLDLQRNCPHVVVGTAGRVYDMIRRRALLTDKIRIFVLDEADEMISMGFKDELEEILKGLKNVDQKWLFSATMPDDIKSIVHDYLSENVERVDVSSKNVVNKNIAHQYIACTENDKLNILFQFLKSQGDNRGVVFCRTKAATQKLAMQLKAKNIATEALHGDLSQRERDKVMRAFKNKTHRVLISTDVAARGIDIDGLTFVIHYQLPEKEEYYTHRAGRTARAGNEGVSLCLITTSEIKKIRF